MASLGVSVIVLRRRIFFFRSMSFNFPGTVHVKTLLIRLIGRPLNIEELSFFVHGLPSLSSGIWSEKQK